MWPWRNLLVEICSSLINHWFTHPIDHLLKGANISASHYFRKEKLCVEVIMLRHADGSWYVYDKAETEFGSRLVAPRGEA